MRVVNSLLVIAILLFATVMTWTYFAVRGEQGTINPQAGIGGGPNDQQSSNYQIEFRTLLTEHGNLATLHLGKVYDGQSIADTSRKLEDNSNKLADLIKELGTAADRTAFLRAFRGHIQEYENYTVGVKEDDQQAKAAAKENLKMHAMDFGNLANKLMPTISEEKGTKLMNDHVNLTLAIVDAHASGDRSKKLEAMYRANQQALQFAGELAKGADAAKNK